MEKNLDSRNTGLINDNADFKPEISLSKNGKNVFLIMLDKAAGVYFKNIIGERSELKSSFEGFIHYPNTISLFRSTILGAPPLFGGYEYTPEKMHQRNKEPMIKKHNESYLVLPELFKQNNYYVSIFDLPYFNYQNKMDISFFLNQGIYANNIEGLYTKKLIDELGENAPVKTTKTELLLKHNFTMFGIFSAVPVLFRNIIYNKGNYWASVKNSRADVITANALQSYAVLHYLPELTDTENTENTFTIFVSNMAHDPSFLQYPDYTITPEISDFGPDLFDGNINSFQYYHINAVSYLLIAKWLDFLKENDVYDNTRIIIVSDHAEVLVDPDKSLDREYTSYNPILLFKDFNSTGTIKTDTVFMTNADTPLLAVKDLFDNTKNPFTGIELKPDKDDGVNVYLGGSSQPQDYQGWEALEKTSSFYHVTDNIFDKNNWNRITKRF